MKREIIFSGLAIVAALAVMSAATFALFDDSEELDVTTTAGSLDAVIQLRDGVPVTATVTLPASGTLAPGDTGTFDFQVANVGDVDGKLAVSVSSVTNSENTCLEPEDEAGDTTCAAGEGELGGQVAVNMLSGATAILGAATLTETQALDTLDGAAALTNGPIVVGGTDEDLTLSYAFLEDAGLTSAVNNRAMGDTVTFTIEFTLTQV